MVLRRGMTDWRRFKHAHGMIKRPKTLRCAWPGCRKKFAVPQRGRLPLYCSHACRQRAYEICKWSRPAAVETLAADMAAAKFRHFLEREVERILRARGVLPPLCAPANQQSKAKLSVVPGGLAPESNEGAEQTKGAKAPRDP
jgi:hypothetical protein